MATFVAVLSAPVDFLWLRLQGHGIPFSVLATLLVIGAFRGAVDLGLKRTIKRDQRMLQEHERAADALQKKRLYFWSRKFRFLAWYLVITTYLWHKHGGAFVDQLGWALHLTSAMPLATMIQLPLLFAANFLIFMGPMMAMGISQVRGFEPGDADWGVKLEDVRGQKEAKEEIRKIITLWEHGDHFVKSGGKRERGILFLGAPGVGKTMLAKAIATGFNCPIVTIPGSGFAQMFMGMDAIIVRWMIRKAKKLAMKWGGQCIVFIDEIDAVGMRRNALSPQLQRQVEIAQAEQEAHRAATPTPWYQIPGGMMGGMGGQGMAINQLLVAMDGVDSPPFMRRLLTNKVNLWLDAMYVFPQKLWKLPLRLPKAKPNGDQIYFVGATNVPLQALDPALVRPGRMGRHIHFRTPTKNDRIDILDLYLGKVAHDSELDQGDAREEMARMMQGYSPAEIEQACSLALTYAHHDSRDAFNRDDLTEAMVTTEAGTALGWGYESEKEERSTAIHEAGHAVCSYLFMENYESTRLSIRRRGETGGHHQAIQTEERSFKTRDELFHDLIWGLGAYAAEVVFYGHNTQGVGGDLGSCSGLAGTMVGRWGMSPLASDELPRDVLRRMEKLGKRLLSVGNFGDVQLPPDKRRDEALLLGHAFLIAYATIIKNKDAVRKVAEALVEKKELFGNDVMELLKSVGLEKPADEIVWPEELV
jgi:ATP-dependent Zn protease